MHGYDPRGYPPAAVTVDLVVLTIRQDELAVLLIRRGEEPYLGKLALPGGFVRPDESLDAAAARELREETGLELARLSARRPPAARAATAELVHLEQLASYGDPGRDPTAARRHGRLPGTGARIARAARLAVTRPRPAGCPLTGLTERLAFDHDRILADGLERARAKLEYSPLATAFCPAEFTVGQLRRVYEIVWGTTLDPRNFHRKVTGTPGFLAPTGDTTCGRARTAGPALPARRRRRACTRRCCGRPSARQPEIAGEAGRDEHVVPGQLVHRGPAKPEQRRVDPVPENIQHVLDPGLAARCQPPQVGAADHDGARAERERLDHVAAAPDAAVEQHLDLAADRFGNRGQRADRGGRAVHVVAAVVRDRDGASRRHRPRAWRHRPG